MLGGEVLGEWQAGLDDVFAVIAGRFARVEPRWLAFAYIRGLLAPMERRNGWTIAEHAGRRSPNAVQEMLYSPCWDPHLVRDDIRDYLVEHLGDPDGVLIADDTGFVKKGVRSAGVQRQYSGTAGKIENCQIGTFLAYASPKGRALIDRELYLPKSWADDPDRCTQAAVPDDVEFATKPQQARVMIERAVAAGVPFAWFTADEAFGQNPGLRDWLQEQDIAYVMATRTDDEVPAGLHTVSPVKEMIASIRAGAWQRLSCGDGAHGPRVYDWAWTPIRTTFAVIVAAGSWPAGRLAPVSSLSTGVSAGGEPGCVTWSGSPVPVGRSRNRFRPRRTRSVWISTRSDVTTPGMPTSPGHGRRRVPGRDPRCRGRKGGNGAERGELIPLTSNEIRRLFARFVLTAVHTAAHIWHWSRYRRRRQEQARACHYRKRLEPP